MLEFVFILTVWQGPNAAHPMSAYPIAITDSATCIGMVEHYDATNPQWLAGVPSCEIETDLESWRGPDFVDFTIAGANVALGPCQAEDSPNCYWDATARGNGQGNSFVDVMGVQYLIEK